MQLSISNFEKGGIGEFNEFLPQIFAWGAYHVPSQKRLFNIKHGLRAQFQMLIWLVLAKQPIYV